MFLTTLLMIAKDWKKWNFLPGEIWLNNECCIHTENSVQRGWGEVEEGTGGMNGNGKEYNKKIMCRF